MYSYKVNGNMLHFNCKNHLGNSRFGFVDGLILHDACESPVELDMDDGFVPMTKERALALQRELRDRSSQVTFQAALRSCENTFACGSPKWKQIRQRLALKEQVQVIPKYGFPLTLDGSGSGRSAGGREQQNH